MGQGHDDVVAPSSRRDLTRVLVSSAAGSAIEFYDFVLYTSAAALIFGPLFFADLPPFAATLVSLSTIAVGFAARPVGALAFSHLGDRVGRKSTLVATTLLMGLSTMLMAALPTQASVGVLAPILLVVLRVAQGVSVGGEWGAAATMAFEHSPASRRGLSASFASAGVPLGATLATGVLGLFALLPPDQFMSWGWRMPFALSGVLVVVALWVRLRVNESPLFAAEQARRALSHPQKQTSPIVALFRRPGILFLSIVTFVAPFLFFSLVGGFGIAFARSSGLSPSAVLTMATIGYCTCAFGEVLGGHLSDRFGRSRVLLFGILLGGLLTYPFLLALGSGSVALGTLGFVVLNFFVLGSAFGPLGAFIGEQFPTSTRFTGASVGYQMAAVLGSGFGPLALTVLLAPGASRGLVSVALLCAVVAIISAAGMLSLDRKRRRGVLEIPVAQ
ncbi:MFS transporter [Pseudonocardia ailaonensis]|uniref:MFS transporter n=1 Tax=Pseudonocardia ailaonensis TaxID=367279 RepID=A0ABN2NJI1_9PSEU